MAKPSKRTKRAAIAKSKPAKPKARAAAKPKPRAAAKPQARTAAKPKARTAAKPKARTAAKPTKPTKPNKPAKPNKPGKPTRPAKPGKPAERIEPGIAPPPPAIELPPPPAPLDEPDRAARIATMATERARHTVDDNAPVMLGSITVPSGTLAIFDVALMGYLPRAALDPMLICAQVPSDRPLPVIGTRVGGGRFAASWDHIAIQLGDAPQPVARSRKLGKAASDFARLICMDRAAIDHWQHEDSLDQLADFVFTGRDEAALAKALDARRLAGGTGHGWHDLPIADAEQLADRVAALKAEHKWLVTTELRPHSHHATILDAARASPAGAGVLDVGGARVLLFFTSWGEGVFPVFLDLDASDHPVQVRIQLATA